MATGGQSWDGANGTQFWLDAKNNTFAVFMVQTQRYKNLPGKRRLFAVP